MKKVAVAVSIILAVIFIVILSGFLFSQRLSEEHFDCGLKTEIKIAHLTDMHFPDIGIKTEEIIASLEKEKPNLIAITGDAFDGDADNADLTEVEDFYKKLISISPVYAVIGNHEIGSSLLENYVALCERTGVRLLLNEIVKVKTADKKLLICGVKDACRPDFLPTEIPNDVTIILAHRPEMIAEYSDFDVALTGHAHGGQARMFSIGLYAPDQGFFPKYTSGLYVYGNTKMIVSRGLGDGKNKFRIFNSYNINYIIL